MEDVLTFIFPFLIFALFAVVALGAQYFYLQRMRRLWGDLAARAGLALDPGSALNRPSLAGTVRGRSLRLYTYSRGAGRNKTTYTAISLATSSPAGWSLSLRPERWYDSLGKSLGAKDIEIGDSIFDQRFKVSATPPEIAAAVLRGNEMLRSTLMQAPPFQIELNGGLLQHHQRGFEGNIDRLMALFGVMSDFADGVEKAAGGDLPEPIAAVEEQAQVLAAEEAPQPLFASDRQPAEKSAMSDPFAKYGSGSSYSPGPADPFSRPQGMSDDTKRTLLIAFFAFDCLVVAGIAAYLLLWSQ